MAGFCGTRGWRASMVVVALATVCGLGVLLFSSLAANADDPPRAAVTAGVSPPMVAHRPGLPSATVGDELADQRTATSRVYERSDGTRQSKPLPLCRRRSREPRRLNGIDGTEPMRRRVAGNR
jgi:hypothetical protein